MSRSNFIPLLIIVVGASILASTGTGLIEGAKTSPIVAGELLERRIDAARKVFEANLQRIQSGEAAIDIGFLSWSQRWLDAELALSDKRADRVAALKAHLGRARDVEKIALTHVKSGQGRESDARAATYFRIDAEVQLLQATSE